MTEVTPAKLTRRDFLSSTEPRWCMGCGTYATLNAMTKVFAESGIPREKHAVISGIGCSSRLPYYSSAYGFHTIHGRAPTVAMGLKMANPDLSVWVVTGDGDGLSIGGNHFIHLMRRNPNIKVVLFNNEIYGLTKGQASPTTVFGQKTKSTPFGTVDRPMHPLSLALGAEATFVARVTDSDNESLAQALTAAAQHKGAALVEVLINCVIFNDGVFTHLTDKAIRDENTLKLQHGQPLLFGKNKDKGIVIKDFKPQVVKVGEGGVDINQIAIHDAHNIDRGYAFMLSELGGGKGEPVPLGVVRQVENSVYNHYQTNPTKEGCQKLLRGDSSWSSSETGSVQMENI